MKSKIHYNHWLFKLPWFGARYRGITLGRHIFVKTGPEDTPYDLILHEMKHVEQVQRIGIIRFYAQYLFEFAINLFHYRDWDLAYRNISFEKEARKAEHLDWLPDEED